MDTLIVASNNKGKINEIKQILSKLYNVISLSEAGIVVDVEETGSTFEENAIIKAVAIYKLATSAAIAKGSVLNSTGKIAVISDDSGLSVESLGGEPGVYSARYSGIGTDEANNQKLLSNLNGMTNRKAKFVSAVALAKGEDDITVAIGECMGEILTAAKGNGGFGYDPLFYSYDLNKTFGEASGEEKNAVSHRANALKNLLQMLNKR